MNYNGSWIKFCFSGCIIKSCNIRWPGRATIQTLNDTRLRTLSTRRKSYKNNIGLILKHSDHRPDWNIK
jgi:hypothetical protein